MEPRALLAARNKSETSPEPGARTALGVLLDKDIKMDELVRPELGILYLPKPEK